MSDRVSQSFRDNDGITKQAVQSYRSVWMAHWMSTSCKPTKQPCSRLSICYESQQANHDSKQDHLLSGPEKTESAIKYEKGLSEITETKTVTIMDDSLIPKYDKLSSERSNYQSFPMFNLQRKGESVLARKNEEASSSHGGKLRSLTDKNPGYQLVSLGGGERHLSSMLQWAPNTETPLLPEWIKEYPERQAIVENNSLALTKSIPANFMGSTSKIVPFGFNFGKTPALSTCKQEESQSNSIPESQEQATNAVYQGNSMLLVHEKAINNWFGRSRNSLSRQTDAALFPHNPSTSRSQHPESVVKQCKKMQDHNGTGLFPSENKPSELIKSEKLYRGCFSLPSLPCSAHDREATSTYATVDSMEESSGDPKKFSTTNHFLFTKTTDFNLTEGVQMLKESTKLKEDISPELFPLDQENSFPTKTGVKLQLLGSSTCGEGEKDATEFKTSSVNLKNESSAETNTMDLDTFRKNHVSGVFSSLSNKHIESEQQSPTSQAAWPPARETGGKVPKTKLPDINQEPSDLAVYASSTDTSTSRTQSLDAEHLLCNAEQPTNLKSSECPVGYPEPEPSSRWVKRLKLSHTSARSTKCSKMEEDSSHEKVDSFFSKIKKCSITSSEPGQSHCKEQTALNQRSALWKGKSPSIDSVRENRDIALSHPWVRRWCHNDVGSPLKKAKAVVVCKPQCPKAMVDKLQKKHFPSLAAMALMGKAMGAFRSCQFTKKGSSVVWSS